MSLPIRKRKLDKCSFPKDDDRKKKSKDESEVVQVNDVNGQYCTSNNHLVSCSEEGSPPTESSTHTPTTTTVSNTSTSDSSFVSTNTTNNTMGISINSSMSGNNNNNESFAVPMNMNDHRTYQQNPVPLPNNNTKEKQQHNMGGNTNTSSTTTLARPRSNSIFSKILEPGTKIQTILLAGRNQNGLVGSIVEYNSSNERYTVEIDIVDGSSGSKKRKKTKKKERIFLKRRNMKRLKESTASPIDGDVDTTQNTNDVSGFTIKTEIGIVQPEDELAEDDISSMKISDLIKELDSYGVNTSNFHEKSELVDALKRARKIISRPPQDASSIRQSKQKSMIRMMCLLGGILVLITAARYSLKGMNGISSISNIKVEDEKENVMDEEKGEATEERERNEMINLVDSILQLKSEDKKDAYYKILGIEHPHNATHDDIKKAYRGRALKLHPDKDKYNTPNATQAFRAVGDVYDVLNDPSVRKRYDKRRFSSAPSSSPSSSKPGRDDDEYNRYGDGDDWHGYSYSKPRYGRRSSSRPYFNYDDDYGYKHKNVSEQEIFWGVMKMYAAGFGIVGVWAMFIKEILWTGSW